MIQYQLLSAASFPSTTQHESSSPSIQTNCCFLLKTVRCFMLPLTSLNYCFTCDALFYLGTILNYFLPLPPPVSSPLVSYYIYATYSIWYISIFTLVYHLSPSIVLHYLSLCLSSRSQSKVSLWCDSRVDPKAGKSW